MTLYSNYKIMECVKFVVLLKYFAFFFFMWIYYAHNEENSLGKSLGNIYKKNITRNLNIKRLLAKHETQKELRNVSLKEKLPQEYHSTYLNMRNGGNSTYKVLKNKGLSDLEIYKKAFKCRYDKKRSLEKFDCYCEKKIFDKMDSICQLAKDMKNEKQVFNKICKMYGLPFFVSGLFCFSAGIILALENIFQVKCAEAIGASMGKFTLYAGDIFFYILPIITFIVLLYIRIKIKKYVRLKEGKMSGKMIAKKISYYFDDVNNTK
ncbi:Plasmodium exported protein, unknown function [Plasmodium vivax]|uniref:Variable surface protein Vir35 n=2 Tax=Plasmodium vivax TaxID=5855 RepID=A0A565A0Y0_PLAVI|nr:Plasmodium exported protein, unknown function [Plasmodium vivax]